MTMFDDGSVALIRKIRSHFFITVEKSDARSGIRAGIMRVSGAIGWKFLSRSDTKAGLVENSVPNRLFKYLIAIASQISCGIECT